MAESGIENLLQEDRTFTPSPDFVAQANARSELFAEADDDFVA